MENNSYLRNVIVVLLYVHLSFGIRIYPDVSELIIREGEKLTLNCTGDEPVQWSFLREINDYNKKVENGKHGIYYSNLTIFRTDYLDTGYFICRSENNASNVAQIYIYCSSKRFPFVTSFSEVNALMFDKAVIPCKPNSPDINVILTRRQSIIRGEVEPIEKYDPKIGFIISTHSIIGSNLFYCYAPEYANGLEITVRVYPPLNGSSSNPHVEAFNSDSKYPIFENQKATLNCSVITSIYTGIKYLEWEFPENVREKIIIRNVTEVRQNEHKFITFFRSVDIHNVTKEDQGNFSCRVMDGDSRTKVSTYSLQIADRNNVSLNIVPEKSNVVTVKLGVNSTVELTAIIESFPAYTTRAWYNGGKKIRTYIEDQTEPYDVIDEKNKSTLRIFQVELKTSGIYQLRVNNSLITKTFNFNVTIEDKPVILYGLSLPSGFLKLNAKYILDCTVDGYPLPQIRWTTLNCNDYPICANNTLQQYLPKSQHKEKAIKKYTVSSTLRIAVNQSMIIQCEASNSLGSATSSSVFLITDYGDEGTDVVLREKYTKPIFIGDNVELTCAASKYRYVDSFTWFLENNEITPSHGFQINNFATNFSYVSTLSIKNIQKNHSGTYFCKTSFNNIQLRATEDEYIFASFISEDNSHTLTVQDVKKPSIAHSNMNGGVLLVVLGTSIKFMIQVYGDPSPIVVWYKDDKPLSFNDHVTLDINKNGYRTVSIANVSREDEGVYSFNATNRGGSAADKLKLIIKGDNETISEDSGSIIENVNLYYITGFLIFFFLSSAYFVLWFIRRSNKKKKKLQKKVEEYGLELEEIKRSALPSLNPKPDISEQTALIPFDKKYEFPREKLEFGNELGSGFNGIVMRAVAVGIVEKNIKTTVAVKLVKNQDELSHMKALSAELKILIRVGQHANVVNLLGACTQDLIRGELAVIVEYCKHGNLRDFLRKQRNNFVSQIKGNEESDSSVTYLTPVCCESIPTREENETLNKNVLSEETLIGCGGSLVSNNELNEPERQSNYLADYENVPIRPINTSDLIRWSLHTALGMEYLVSRQILHGDLAARNVLLAEGFVAKICDFGFAKNIYQNQEYKTSKTKLPIQWMAIESIGDKIFTTQSDIWSFGITMWEFFSLALSPYPGMSTSEIYGKLKSGYRMETPKFATDEIYKLMKDCWNHSPHMRPSFTKLRERLESISEELCEKPESVSKSEDPTQSEYEYTSPDISS